MRVYKEKTLLTSKVGFVRMGQVPNFNNVCDELYDKLCKQMKMVFDYEDACDQVKIGVNPITQTLIDAQKVTLSSMCEF